MAEVLAQAEIDALLMAVSVGSVDTQPKSGGADGTRRWEAYDLTAPDKGTRHKMPGLAGIYDGFARHLRATLAATLKKSVMVSVGNIDYLPFGDYAANVMLPTSITLIPQRNLGGSQLLVFSARLAYALVDAYYGGNERPFSKMSGRDRFTQIENSMIVKIARLAVRDLAEAWKPVFPLELEYEKSETNPQFVGAIQRSELTAVVNLEVEFESLSGSLVAIVPLRPLEPIQKLLGSGVAGEYAGEADAWHRHWRREIAITPLTVQVELGGSEVSLREVQSWRPGETLPVRQDAASPLKVFIEGVPKLEGLMGAYHGNNAVRLLRAPSPAPTPHPEKK